MLKFLGHIWSVHSSVGAVWAAIYALNHVLVCMRLEMAMEIGFKKWNKGMMSGLPTDSPLALFWDC